VRGLKTAYRTPVKGIFMKMFFHYNVIYLNKKLEKQERVKKLSDKHIEKIRRI